MSPTQTGNPIRILVVSSWQTANIGDVAHSPGAITALRRTLPDADITLLAMNLDDRERLMFARHFPRLRLVEADGWQGGELPQRIAAEFDRADVLVHGSGPSVVVPQIIDAWRECSDKPYGFFGITVDPFRQTPATLDDFALMIAAADGDLLGANRALLDGAAFIYCRDSLTRELLRRQEVATPLIEFGPDATAVFDAFEPRPLASALESLLGPAAPALAEPVLCVVPRLRYTPYHRVHSRPSTLDERRRDAYNAAYVDRELGVLDHAIEWWLTETAGSVLVVPEMSYAMELSARRWSSTDRLRVLTDFWELGDAATVYQHAAAVISMECHSPLIALAVGTPGMYLRQPTDTMKGQMYHDLGLSGSIAEIDDDAVAKVRAWLTRSLAPAARQHTRSVAEEAAGGLAEMSRTVAAVAERVRSRRGLRPWAAAASGRPEAG